MKKVKRNLDDYKDIIDLPHHISHKRKEMSIQNRAAQFAPFAAVVGHDTAIHETARLTEKRKELDETQKAIIDDKLRQIDSKFLKQCEIEMIYFKPDETKEGGRYVSKIGCVKKIDAYNLEVVFADGDMVDIHEIYSIELDL